MVLVVKDKFGSWFIAGAGGSDRTGWVVILCSAEGANGWPGLVQVYDPHTKTYSDLDGSSTNVQLSIGAGEQEVVPDSMDGIAIGTVLLVVDGLCGSQSVTVDGVFDSDTGTGTGTPTVSFTASFPQLAVSYGIVGVTVTNGGTGYEGTVPNVTFSGGSGSGLPAATATLDVTGDQVVLVTVTSPGQDYSSPPAVTFDPPSGTGGTTATGVPVISGSTKLYLNGVWVQFNPGEYEPEQNDVDEPVYFFARMEAPLDLPVWLALGGLTVVIPCPSGPTATLYAGRLQSYG
jgi:hypothetical protein